MVKITENNTAINDTRLKDHPVTYFKGAIDPKPVGTGSFADFLQKMLNPSDKLKATTDKLPSKQNDKKKYEAYREKYLPAVVPGKATKRNNQSFEEHSEILGFDIDDLEGEDLLGINLELLEKIPFVLAAFPSPSMRGIRVFVYTDCTPQTRKIYYQEIRSRIAEALQIPDKKPEKSTSAPVAHVDHTTNDPSRLWFFTAVPANLIYIAPQLHVFTMPKEDNREKSSRQPAAPRPAKQSSHRHTQEQKVEYLIRKIEATRKDITAGVINHFKQACAIHSEFGEHGRKLFHRICQFHDDYDISESDRLYDKVSQLKSNTVTVATFWKWCKDKGITIDWRELNQMFPLDAPAAAPAPAPAPPAAPMTVEEEQEPEKKLIPFFSAKVNDKKVDINIYFIELVRLFKHLGFRRYDKDEGHFIVHIKNNVVRECSVEDVVDAVEEYLYQFSDEEIHESKEVTVETVINKLYAGISTYFSERILARLRPSKPIRFNEHQKDRAFFYYRNGYVEVTEKEAPLKPYSQLQGCVWENQILDRDYIPKQPHQFRKFSFYRFVQIISNNYDFHPETKAANSLVDPARELALKTVMGYLLHDYFERSLMGVILTDSKIDEDGDNNGRSGKTLLVKALGHMLNRNENSATYKEINGKDFDPTRTHKYQTLRVDTKLVHINDAKRNFKAEVLYNDVTEGIYAEGKNKTPFHIRAKIAVSSNNTIRIQGSSAKGRFIEVEVADYFNDRYTPEDEFGEWFFRDWDADQWGMFDSFMMHCVQSYFKHDVQRPSTINLDERKKLEETSPEFVEWMESKDKVFVPTDEKGDAIKFNKRDLFVDFIGRYPELRTERRQLRQNTFTKWLKLYCQYDKTYLPIVKKEDDKERSIETRSNGETFIQFFRVFEPS
ncbi:BT4734/BF3469 family protein [Phaeodactylibacter xiamenensis]|uniref:BT4734/BF3469 family protein n=1 Tax=Phaeodactylibacter xiamenensis TaxID=1524460 RepID=UPI003CCB74E8